MPQVPGFKPSQPSEPNHELLAALREQKSRVSARRRKDKGSKKRDEYWLNNPIYKFPHPSKNMIDKDLISEDIARRNHFNSIKDET